MITSTQTVCVVIPMYRAELSASEQVSLDRCVSVLGKHPIRIAKPLGLNLQVIASRYPQLAIESFPDDYFTGVEGYNRLMLSDEFYARFDEYQYILIYQLDAFVFEDELDNWCSKQYDYVGAPWIPHAKIPSQLTLLRLAIRRRIFRLVSKRYRNNHGDHHGQQHYSAGNGGFSLRKVASMRKILVKLGSRANPYRLNQRSPWAEDIFFSIEANRYRRNLRIPGFVESARFAWETHPEVAAHFTKGQLPFGCHAWNKFAPETWKSIFADAGYRLDEILTQEK